MTESKLLEQDKDEWFYHSMKKYSNLYMFDLEYPLDSLEVINEASLCVSGVQEYSKKCELLQLCVPPKLLRSEDEEGLCKDRDFKILSGGYTENRVRQIKFLRRTSNMLATSQDGYNGVVIYEVGDDNRATILERQRLTAGESTTNCAGPLYAMRDRVLLGVKYRSETVTADLQNGITLYEWKIDDNLDTPVKTRSIWSKTDSGVNPGQITKIKEWDDQTCIFLTSRGTVALYDLRTESETPNLFFHATKSPNNSFSLGPSAPIIFSFDSIPEERKIGVLDSCGGYEVFDPRFVGGSDKSKSSESSSSAAASTRRTITGARSVLPDFARLAGVYPDWFNIEYEQGTKVREKDSRCSNRFIISGLKKECVPVYEEVVIPGHDAEQKLDNESSEKQDALASVFSHDGHSKPVTHSIWHPVSTNLIFSASLDAVLHAWQFIPENHDNSKSSD